MAREEETLCEGSLRGRSGTLNDDVFERQPERIVTFCVHRDAIEENTNDIHSNVQERLASDGRR